MLRKFPYYLLATLCVMIGIYPAIYFIIDRKFGLLSYKSAQLLSENLWNIAFYTHIILGGIALLVGWIQFNKKWRNRNLNLHRKIGKVYVVSVLISAIAGFYIALHATGGIVPKLGFIGMDLAWFFTTLFSFIAIKNGKIIEHQKLMIYSYAVCFSAVTLRIWLPILSSILGGFLPAYRIVAWLSWIPNVIVAYFIIKYQFKNNQLNTQQFKTSTL